MTERHQVDLPAGTPVDFSETTLKDVSYADHVKSCKLELEHFGYLFETPAAHSGPHEIRAELDSRVIYILTNKPLLQAVALRKLSKLLSVPDNHPKQPLRAYEGHLESKTRTVSLKDFDTVEGPKGDEQTTTFKMYVS